MKAQNGNFFSNLLPGSKAASKIIIPLSDKPAFEDTYTIIWNGISTAYRFVKGQWVRDAAYDYQFDVIQKRYDNKWRSVKSMHRIHPDYDGRAGFRDQTMYFAIDYNSLKDNAVQVDIQSSIGNGFGHSDTEFRDMVLTLVDENASKFSPYNKIRITQKYNYESGLLTETVELLLDKNGQETPFMKNEERAYFYLKGKLDHAPTTFQS